MTEVNWVGYVNTSRGPPRIVIRVTVRKVSLKRSAKLATTLAMVKIVARSSLSHSVTIILSWSLVIHLLQNKDSRQFINLCLHPGNLESTIGPTKAGSRF